jgi:hypothetical protein
LDLDDLQERWRANARARWDEEWQWAMARGDATAEDYRTAQVHGFRAPLDYFQMASEADDETACGLFFGGSPCEVREHLHAGRVLDFADLGRISADPKVQSFVMGLVGAGDLVKARCDISQRQAAPLFSFGGPEGRIVLAVRDEYMQRADAIAFRLDDPGGFAMLFDHAAVLGEWVLRDAWYDAHFARARVTLKVFADPLAWIRGGGRGICVLSWQRALWLLRGLGERVTLECDAGAGARIKALIEIGGLPKVKERAPRASTAAGICDMSEAA